jgi:hypothetical protein
VITISAQWLVLAIIVAVGLIGVANAWGWSSGWRRRSELAEDFERLMLPLQRGLGFARARAGWRTAESRDGEERERLLS